MEVPKGRLSLSNSSAGLEKRAVSAKLSLELVGTALCLLGPQSSALQFQFGPR